MRIIHRGRIGYAAGDGVVIADDATPAEDREDIEAVGSSAGGVVGRRQLVNDFVGASTPDRVGGRKKG